MIQYNKLWGVVILNENIFSEANVILFLVDAKAGITDLRFHDLRHDGISRLFENGWAIQEVALVSGHHSWSSLKRYTNLKEETILKKF